jgi:hypothetical protein
VIGLLSVWFISPVTLKTGLLPGVHQWQIEFAKLSISLESENCTQMTYVFKILLSVLFSFSIMLFLFSLSVIILFIFCVFIALSFFVHMWFLFWFWDLVSVI